MKKRIFAILLALVMLLSALPVTTSAAVVSDVKLGETKQLGSARILTQWLSYSRLHIDWPTEHGMVLIDKGKTGTMQVLPSVDHYNGGGNYLYTEFPDYFGLPEIGSVEVSTSGIIANCTYDLAPLAVDGFSGTLPSLRLNYDVVGEGKTTVTMNYYYSYDNSTWYVGQHSFVVNTDTTFVPDQPTDGNGGDLDKYGDPTFGAVYYVCNNDLDSNHTGVLDELDCEPSNPDKPYTIGEVVPNSESHLSVSGYEGFTKEKYPWMCNITLDLVKYVDHYNASDWGIAAGTHYLKKGADKTFTIRFFSDGEKWYCAKNKAVRIDITHDKNSAEDVDITLTYDGHHNETISGMPDPASVTKPAKANVGASFDIANGPTCDVDTTHKFVKWNTKADGSGKSYMPGDKPTFTTSTTLYAQWNDSGSGGDDNEPTNPPSSGENGDIEKALYGKNVTVRCVNNENAHEEKPYDAKLGLTSASPVKIDVGLTLGETTYKTAYEIKLSADKFVDLYSKSTAEGGSGEAHHRKDGTAAELTWIIYWDASLLTDNKWAAYENDQKIVEAEHTVTEPTTPPSTEELRPLLGKVKVDCVDRTVKHNTLEYDAVDGLVEGSLQKVAGGYQTGSGQHYDTAYTCTLSGAKFAQLYSGKTTDTPAGSGVAHTLKTPETIACTVYWNPIEGKWVATKETSVIQTTHAEYTVTFKYQVNGYSDKTQTVVAGSTVTKPADERREGYTLEGWYETADCTGEKFNFSTPINANKILYAKWTAKQVPYTIRHRDKDTNETVAPDTTGTGAYGEKITLTPKTDIADYVPAEGNPQYSWLKSEVGNIFTLRYVKLFTVSFDCHMDGMTIAAKTVQRNAKVTSPGTLTRTGYAFGGWYKNLSDAAAYDFDTPVTESFTLHAKWTPRTDIPYTVKYLEEGTNKELHAAKTGTGTFNTTVQVTAEAISGYTLVGSSPRDLKLENVSNNELIFYYTKDPVKVSYTVHYYLDGTTTKVAADKVVNNVNAGTEVTEDAISVTGYTAAAPTQQKLNLSATGTNEIIFYYTKNVGTQVAYTIRYLKESTGEALLPAYSGTGVVGNSLTVTAPAIDGYTALAPTSYTITLNAEAAENIITFYYREATSTIPAGEPAKEPFNKNANPRQLNRDDHFAYIKGYPDGTVRPEASLTRAEAAAILYRVMEKSCVERFHAESSSFRDVPDGKWYTTYVATLEKAGVIVDSKDGNFRPNDAITRAELASMLAQFANVTGGTNTFSDVPATHWAADYIAAAVRSGWIQGYPDGTFRPEQTIKRAEMTAMVNRALGRDPQSASDLLEGMKTWKDNADPTAWFYLDIQEAANGHTYARKTGGEYWTGLVADVVQ